MSFRQFQSLSALGKAYIHDGSPSIGYAPDTFMWKRWRNFPPSAIDEKNLHPKCPAKGQQASSSPGWSCPVEPALSSRVRLPSLGPDPAWPGTRTKPPTQDQSAPDKPPGIILLVLKRIFSSSSKPMCKNFSWKLTGTQRWAYSCFWEKWQTLIQAPN